MRILSTRISIYPKIRKFHFFIFKNLRFLNIKKWFPIFRIGAYGINKESRVKAIPATTVLIFTRRACLRTWASSAGSSIFSTWWPNWREPRADRPVQVWSRHWKKPDADPAKKGSSANRHQRLTPNANKTARMARLTSNSIMPNVSRLRRSAVLILGVHTAPLAENSGMFIFIACGTCYPWPG